jgi:hypothetical protein
MWRFVSGKRVPNLLSDPPTTTRKPVFVFIGGAFIPVFLIAYFPLFTFWCHYIEAHVPEVQKHNGAYINGLYALDVTNKPRCVVFGGSGGLLDHFIAAPGVGRAF